MSSLTTLQSFQRSLVCSQVTDQSVNNQEVRGVTYSFPPDSIRIKIHSTTTLEKVGAVFASVIGAGLVALGVVFFANGFMIGGAIATAAGAGGALSVLIPLIVKHVKFKKEVDRMMRSRKIFANDDLKFSETATSSSRCYFHLSYNRDEDNTTWVAPMVLETKVDEHHSNTVKRTAHIYRSNDLIPQKGLQNGAIDTTPTVCDEY